VKEALGGFALRPNNSLVWTEVTAMVEDFLTGLWKQGALVGAKAEDAFAVQCGLGTTMTAEDRLGGIMYVSIMVAMTHPAEFIILTLQQQLQPPSD
jgi:phage tail sheath protein FI